MALIETAPARARYAPPSRPAGGWLGWGTIALALGAASVALLGPLVTAVIEYHASKGAVNQIMGGDVAGLVLAAPV